LRDRAKNSRVLPSQINDGERPHIHRAFGQVVAQSTLPAPKHSRVIACLDQSALGQCSGTGRLAGSLRQQQTCEQGATAQHRLFKPEDLCRLSYLCWNLTIEER